MLNFMTIIERLDTADAIASMKEPKYPNGYFKEAIDEAVKRMKNEIELKDKLHRRNKQNADLKFRLKKAQLCADCKEELEANGICLNLMEVGEY